jgi:hypothetical protein
VRVLDLRFATGQAEQNVEVVRLEGLQSIKFLPGLREAHPTKGGYDSRLEGTLHGIAADVGRTIITARFVQCLGVPNPRRRDFKEVWAAQHPGFALIVRRFRSQ